MVRRLAAGSVGFNTAANFVSQFIAPSLGLLLIPVYLHFVGLAGYGLLALLTAILATSGVLTRGLGWSLQREVAHATAAGDSQRLSRLVSTFAVGYWSLGGLLGLLLLILSRPVSGLLDRGEISLDTVMICLVLLSFRVGTLFPASVYQAVLLGTRRQLLLNVINSVALLVATAATIAGIATTNSVVAFYVADLVVSCGTLFYLRRVVAAELEPATPNSRRHLSRQELRALAGLSGGLVWVQGIGILIRQADRLVVGAVTSLAQLGVYGASIASGRILSLAYAPFLTAVFPESCVVARNDPSGLPEHVIGNSRIVALTSVGVGVPVALAGHQLLMLWTQSQHIADLGTPVLVIYVIGTMFLALADTESQAQTAIGTSRCAVVVNTAAALWLGPVLYILVQSVGIEGAAITWLIYGSTAWVAHTLYTFGRLMPGNLFRYLRVVSIPISILVVLNVIVAAGARMLVEAHDLLYIMVIGTGAVAALAAAALASFGPETSRVMLRKLAGQRGGSV